MTRGNRHSTYHTHMRDTMVRPQKLGGGVSGKWAEIYPLAVLTGRVDRVGERVFGAFRRWLEKGTLEGRNLTGFYLHYVACDAFGGSAFRSAALTTTTKIVYN